MTNKEIMEGLKILDSYTIDKYSVEAEHDMLYFNSTTRVINIEDLKRLVDMGWMQDSIEEFTIKDYNPADSWFCYV